MKAELVLVLAEAPGLSSEMDEGEIVPSELFGSLGLLIVESRVPHLSSKGHVEGPHIPSTSSYVPSKHACSTNSFLCGRMEAVRRQMQVLWKNHIPMCIEVLLFPDCEHGSQLAALQDVTLPSGRDTSILLEQWTVQVLPRRGGESVARARELFQAMKSYLHFSQLSAWLNLTHGKAPRNVAYRVSPPAEFCTSSFQEHPQWHTFPICSMTKTSVIKVTVGALPRRNNIIHVPCPEFHPLGQFVRTTSSGASVVTTKAPCRPQQTLQPPQDDGSRYRNRLSLGHGQGKHRKSPSRDRKSGFNQQGMGWEGEKQQLPIGSGSGPQPYSRKMPPNLQTSQGESQLTGESRGRGRESPGVPTHLDFSKIRQTSEQFCDYRHFLVLPPQGQSDLKPDRSVQMPPFPYPQPMCPPHPHHPHHHLHHPSQPQPYLDPSLITHQKRSSPAVPRMDQSPFPLQQQPQQPPYNAFLYNQPRLYPQTPEDLPSYNPMQYLGAIPKRSSFVHHKSPPDTQAIRDFFPFSPPIPGDPGYFLQQPDPTQQKSVKAESPKVLFSRKSPGQMFYTRDDPMWVPPVATQESEGSDGSSPEIDRFLKNMPGSVQPLSPEEIQNYLSRLSFHQNRSRREKDINPLACKSLTEKDFVEAELSQQAGDDSLHHQQQLPVKLAKALEEANKDLPLSNRLVRTSSCSPREKKELESEFDERSVTPTPSLSPHQVDEDLPPKSHQSKGEEDKVCLSCERSPSPKVKESKSCQTVDPDPAVKIDSDRQANGSPELLCSSSPRASHNTSPSPSSLGDLGQEHPIKTVTSHKIPKAKRPMSPLTKKLQEAEKERSLSPLTVVTNGAQKLTTQSVSNGVSCSNGTTESAKEIRDSSPDDNSSNGHSSDISTEFENKRHTTSHLPDEAPEVLPCVDSLRSYEDNQNNNAKGEVKNNTGDIELLADATCVVEDAKPSTSTVSSVNEEEQKPPGRAMGHKKATPLLHSLLRKDLSEQMKSQEDDAHGVSTRAVPTPQERASFRRSLDNSTNMIFHAATGLPLQSSPAPIKKRTSGCFDYDSTLTDIRAIKNSLSCANLEEQNSGSKTEENEKTQGRLYSASAPASTNCLLGNFEESLLNGRIEPSGVVEGFTAELGASGTFCPKHVVLPVTAFFFNLSDDNAPSPYLGHINLDSLGRRGYHVPKKGTVQVTLFNPNKTVVKMFVVMYNLTHMPPNCQTFLRQRTLYMPVSGSPSDIVGEPVFLRYLIHLRFSSSKSGKIYLHTDLRMIFARNKFEYDSSVASYELRSFTEGPINPKFSPKR